MRASQESTGKTNGLSLLVVVHAHPFPICIECQRAKICSGTEEGEYFVGKRPSRRCAEACGALLPLLPPRRQRAVKGVPTGFRRLHTGAAAVSLESCLSRVAVF